MPDSLRHAVVIILLELGLLLPGSSWIDWARTERALRLGLPLPDPPATLPLAAGVVIIAGLMRLGVPP